MLPNKTNSFFDVTATTSDSTHVFLYLFTVFVKMAAVRLRKAFQYPEESDEREELDEEEQERVIEQLQSQNDARNAQYSVHMFPIYSSFNAKFSRLSSRHSLC